MILAVKRAKRYSPNSEEKDAAIMDGVCDALRKRDKEVVVVSEEDAAWPAQRVELCLTMGRMPSTLLRLSEMESCGVQVLNSTGGVRLCCQRRRLNEALRREGVTLPPAEGRHGYWLKRADGCAEAKGDIRYAANAGERDRLLAAMKAEGMDDTLVQAHVEGDLVKFYGVAGTGFFRTFYPGDDGQSKFGDERLNGKPQHYAFAKGHLRQMAERAAKVAGTPIYGGDAIIEADGSACIIDFNDWPSFSRCRAEAAEAIALLAIGRLQGADIKTRKE